MQIFLYVVNMHWVNQERMLMLVVEMKCIECMVCYQFLMHGS